MLLWYRTYFPDHPVRTFRMDNAKEFWSHLFEDYCVASGITLTYSGFYEHSQNSLAEAFIKIVQLIAQPLLLHAKLSTTFWSHVVFHAATLLKYRSTLLNDHTPTELTFGQVSNVTHLRVFGCRVWVPVAEPHRKTIGSHRQEGIYVGFDSPSILCYVHPVTKTLHQARFANCHFEETSFSSLVVPNSSSNLDFWAPTTFTLNLDPQTALANLEVERLLHFKSFAERLLDGFSSTTRILRNPLPGTSSLPLSVLLKPALPKERKNEDVAYQPSSHQSHLVQTSHLEPTDSSEPTASPPESAAPLSSDQSPSDSDPQSLADAKTRSNWP